MIESGELPPGSQLPTELELRDRYSASRNTVRDAIKWLTAHDLVETRPGQGTFVVGRDSAARRGRSGRLGFRDEDTEADVLRSLYAADQGLVACSIIALRRGARLLQRSLGVNQDIDPLSLDGAQELGDRWDVLQNYAEAEFPEAHPILGDQPLHRDLIDASYDPAWRTGLRIWAEQNAELVNDTAYQHLPAFDHAAALELGSYVGEFAGSSLELDAALAAGRLPFSPDLVARSADLARLMACLWRITSADSPLHRRMLEEEALDSLGGQLVPEKPQPVLEKVTQRHPPGRSRSRAQAEGARLEASVLDIFEFLFRFEGDDVRRLRGELRRQSSGTQYGTDIVFRATAVNSSSTCLVECKNYTTPLRVAAVADKVLQAEASFEAEPVDHWILVSPHQDPSNELDLLVQRWNSAQKFPFTVQIWSPQSGVRDLFAVAPTVYREVYEEDPVEPRLDPSVVVAEFAERLRPTIRLSKRLAKYVMDQQSFTQPSERVWLGQLESQIERFGFDEKDTRLARPLQTEILSALFDSPSDSNVALLFAEFGEGKSFFTVSLCCNLRARYLAAPRSASPIPIRMFLRGYRHVSSPTDFLRTQLEFIGLGMEEWSELIQLENILVILDGLDEMSVRQDPTTTRSNLDKIGALLELLEGLPVLVTSRPHFLASGPDRERFYDRLRRPHIFRMRQPDRRDTVVHLRAYADSLSLSQKLNKIKELYDPIGLACKVLFLEMIKETLPDLPEDHFDEMVLYETYVKKSLRRKVELLRDPNSTLHDSELFEQLENVLEKVALAIHVSGEGIVDLRKFVAETGGAAQLLWRASETDQLQAENDEDATARIGSRSLLRRAASESKTGTEEVWLVDFFHRSMKEYFVARALRRALAAGDAFAAIRNILIKAPMQPEILGFFKLLVSELSDSPAVLASAAHSARVGSGQGFLGGGAISCYHAAGGQLRNSEWRSLDLDGALLARSNLSESDFWGSTLRGADLSLADLTSADLRESDLTEANLNAGGSIIAFAPDTAPNRYVCLTQESRMGRIAIDPDGTMRFNFIPLPRPLRWPERLFMLAEDLVLITAHSEFLIVEIGSGTAEEVAHFRISSDLRAVTVVDQSFLGLLIEPESGPSEAALIDIDTGRIVWTIPVSPHGGACGWTADSVMIAYTTDLIVYRPGTTPSTIHSDLQPSGNDLSLSDNAVIMVTDDGQAVWTPFADSISAESVAVHSGAGTAVIAVDGEVLSAGCDGSVALIKYDGADRPEVVSRIERRLQCSGARVGGMRGDRERLIFLTNNAIES